MTNDIRKVLAEVSRVGSEVIERTFGIDRGESSDQPTDPLRLCLHDKFIVADVKRGSGEIVIEFQDDMRDPEYTSRAYTIAELDQIIAMLTEAREQAAVIHARNFHAAVSELAAELTGYQKRQRFPVDSGNERTARTMIELGVVDPWAYLCARESAAAYEDGEVPSC